MAKKKRRSKTITVEPFTAEGGFGTLVEVRPGVLRKTARPGKAWTIKRELACLRRLAGVPGILSVLDAGDDWLEIPRIPARTIRTLGDWLDTARVVLRCHARGVVHNDLKPNNVLQGPWLIDFGLSWCPGLGLPPRHDEYFYGTTYMLPPEITTDAVEPSPETDAYQLGVLLFILTEGRPPTLHPWAHAERGETAWRGAQIHPLLRDARDLLMGDRDIASARASVATVLATGALSRDFMTTRTHSQYLP